MFSAIDNFAWQDDSRGKVWDGKHKGCHSIKDEFVSTKIVKSIGWKLKPIRKKCDCSNRSSQSRLNYNRDWNWFGFLLSRREVPVALPREEWTAAGMPPRPQMPFFAPRTMTCRCRSKIATNFFRRRQLHGKAYASFNTTSWNKIQVSFVHSSPHKLLVDKTGLKKQS